MSLTINLLPWREARRERRTRRFQLLLLAMLMVGSGLGFGVARYYQTELGAQTQRNAYIREQTQVLEEDIGQVHEYEARVSQLKEQLALFQALQRERVQTIRLFNAVAKSVAPGVIYQHLERRDETVSVTARANTDRQVSEQLRRIALTPALSVPALSEVENTADDATAERRFRFVVDQPLDTETPESRAEGIADDV